MAHQVETDMQKQIQINRAVPGACDGGPSASTWVEGLQEHRKGYPPSHHFKVVEQAPSSGGCRRRDEQLRLNIFRRCEHERAPDVDVGRLLENRYIQRRKRSFDLAVGGLLLALSSPLWLLIAVLIKLDSPGPVFFKQERTGYLGRRFRMLKFRTMVADAEQWKHALLHLNIHGDKSPDFKIADDPRITRVGRFLRNSSLDELPNLVNVLKGDMSIVGPRPTSFHARTYASHHLSRLALKPGITGLWQVSGRADVDFDQRTKLDVLYINRASLAFDLMLLLKTPLKIRCGAY